VCAATIDLSHAAVRIPQSFNGTGRKAVALLVEEVEKRSQVRWPVENVASGTCVEMNITGNGRPAEGYRIETGGAGCAVKLTGNDSRGLLYAAGRLLRELRIHPGSVVLPEPLNITTAPHFAIRGHQLGYREANNTWDAWSAAQFEQYIRDLAVFGSNTIELTAPGPPRASPHFKLTPLEMDQQISRICAEYGLDVSIWLPAPEKDYADAATVERALREWDKLFAALPKLDAVFVPGGDPGHTRPGVLMPFLEKASAVLRKHHPKAQMWISPQGLDEEWLNELYTVLRTEPTWLNGIVHGPWARVSPEQLRAAVPGRYPIRLYPDISHTMRCQHPVRDWDRAFALTYVREPINPRPKAEAEVVRTHRRSINGFITYSDGSNDDVNKIVWSALGWDPDADITTALHEYGRFFVGAEEFGDTLAALERNWVGRLAENNSVAPTLRQLRALENPERLKNWRFQQALYRATYDAYTQQRLRAESTQEERAYAALRNAAQSGSAKAMDTAEKALATAPIAMELRERVRQLAQALFETIGMQLSVKLYQGAGWERGVTLDTLDEPLNDRPWLMAEFARIRKMADEKERLAEINALVRRTDPGPGGFYDDVGNPPYEPHVVKYGDISLQGYTRRGDQPLAWFDHATSWPGRPVVLRYTGLDPNAAYKVRVVYAGENVNQEQGIRMMANGTVVVHPYMKRPLPVRPVEFDIPREATRTGTLTLEWDREAPPSGRIRGAQVSEVWLLRK
jgi:hypothetical protein